MTPRALTALSVIFRAEFAELQAGHGQQLADVVVQALGDALAFARRIPVALKIPKNGRLVDYVPRPKAAALDSTELVTS